MQNKSLNRGLSAAKVAKQDEFYTQYVDIQKEVEAYLEFNEDTFRDKVVYCNCDDPFESNFFKYFAANFNKLGLKKLITTSYDGSPIAGQGTSFPEYDDGHQKPKALAVIIDHVIDEDGDGVANIDDVKLFLKRNKAARIALKGDDEYSGGDFRSAECIALLKQADIVVTNPPFSLFREYVAQLVEYSKKFLIIGNKNAITYKEIFPLIKDNKMWVGVTAFSGGMWFVADYMGKYEKVVDGVKLINVPAIWFTNMDHGRRHQKLSLMTMAANLRFSKHKGIRGKAAYDRYDNYSYSCSGPCLMPNGPHDRRNAHAVLVPQRRGRGIPRGVTPPDVGHASLSEDCPTVSLPAGLPPLLNLVSHVVGRRAEEQVGRVTARGVVALVEDRDPLRDEAISHLPGCPVSHDCLHAESEPAIAATSGPEPGPALASTPTCDCSPQPVCEGTATGKEGHVGVTVPSVASVVEFAPPLGAVGVLTVDDGAGTAGAWHGGTSVVAPSQAGVPNSTTPGGHDKCYHPAIEVSKVKEIPSDYDGVMGVPITFLDKYNSDQFEIVKFRKGDDDKDLSVNGKCPYFRILIRHRARPAKRTKK